MLIIAQMNMNSQSLSQIGLMTALLTILGMIKLPSFFPGAEFQLSAPLAVAICSVFGFKKYMIAGILSSCIGLILGTQNIMQLWIVFIFRGVVGAMVTLGGKYLWVLVIAGPVASFASRCSLGLILGKAVLPLLLAAVPGMIYTGLMAVPLTKVLAKIKNQTEKRIVNVVQR